MRPDEPELPDDLRHLEDRLRRGRAHLDALDADRLKQRARAQFMARRGGSGLIRSRLAAATTAVALLAGAGGAVALSGLDSHPNAYGGAADHQYKHPKHCGHGHVKKHGECVLKPKHCPKGKVKKHGKCVAKPKHNNHHSKGSHDHHGKSNGHHHGHTGSHGTHHHGHQGGNHKKH